MPVNEENIIDCNLCTDTYRHFPSLHERVHLEGYTCIGGGGSKRSVNMEGA